MRIGVLCVDYLFEVSPFIKNLVSYLADLDGCNAALIFDAFHRDKQFRLSNGRVSLCQLQAEHKTTLWSRIESRIFRSIGFERHAIIAPLVRDTRRVLHEYDFFFLLDFTAFYLYRKAGGDPARCAILLLEGDLVMQSYPRSYVVRGLLACKGLIVADRERELDLNRILKTEIRSVAYIPVSLRPPATGQVRSAAHGPNETIRMVYSGYFAHWALVKELIALVSAIVSTDVWLTVQGHSLGTEEYLSACRLAAGDSSRITFDDSFIQDDQYTSFLSQFDVGVALYSDIEQDGNFANILFSSGKIASYLWSGLAVVTNIDHPLTRLPPFLFVGGLDVAEWKSVLGEYEQKREEYREAAHLFADRYYNFDKYASDVIPALLK